MSIVVRKYATAFVNDPVLPWTNPQFVINAADNQCAFRRVIGQVSILTTSTYGFNIPADAVIIRETIGFKSGKYLFLGHPANTVITFYLRKPPNTWGVDGPQIAAMNCTLTQFRSVNLLGNPLSIADLNNENFTTWIRLESVAAPYTYAWGYADCVYIEVEYTVPAVPRAGLNVQRALPIILE